MNTFELSIGVITFMSNRSHVFSRSGEARYSKRFINLGMGS